MNRLLTVLAALPVLALGACSQVEDAATDAASDAGNRAGCAVAGRVVDEGRTLVGDIATDLGADPASARAKLTAAREALAAAAPTLSDDTRAQLDRAVAALDDLRDEATSVADGSSIDEQVVAEAKAEYDVAAEQITSVC
ncbi:hypothetical protein [Aeromicrobium fastidiosum]|uniref:Secreted protein n=1 Tax=Aeromicrobium fastidiosum TaxID=52699 RepID=A0A641AR53_9ACTN|nr:hypothetical protein [Aeromicrobium fastidiosum]KAA1380570.1 hypothetical protein ESP62_005165 [Aeromicrobium fastidiosum]MBP2390165.1 hypothetical protein [Aeromicrobium fastidiosum]